MNTPMQIEIFCLALTTEQIEFLCKPKYCERRMKLYSVLLSMTSERDSQSTKRGINIPVSVGKVEISEVILAAHLRWNRKTVSDYIKAFNDIGLIKTSKDNKSSVHSILTLSGWLHGNDMIRNPLYHRPMDKAAVLLQDKTETSISVITEASSADISQTNVSTQGTKPSASEQDYSKSYKSADGMDPEQSPSISKEHSSDFGTEN